MTADRQRGMLSVRDGAFAPEGGVTLAAKKKPEAERQQPELARMKVQYVLDTRQVQALRAEAFKRAAARGTGQADASEVLREILDAWLARRSR